MRNLLIAAALSLMPGIATAQAPANICSGTFATIRISTIKPGKIAAFEQAVKDQNAWYAGKGAKSYSKIARVYGERGLAYVEDERMTITFHPDPSAGRIPHDAGWDAFVAEFRDSSAIKEDRRVCLPDLSGK